MYANKYTEIKYCIYINISFTIMKGSKLNEKKNRIMKKQLHAIHWYLQYNE